MHPWGAGFPADSSDPAGKPLAEADGVVLVRELTTGLVTVESLLSLVYLVALGSVAMAITHRRLGRLLLT